MMYKCPKCKKVLERDGKAKTVKSFCSSTGKNVVLKQVKKKKP